jgi:hypothetical protein
VTTFTVPADYSRIRVVGSFKELVSARFTRGVNALCWPRQLAGDFAEVVALLDAAEGVTVLEEAHLLSLPASPAGQVAVEALLTDQRLLRELGVAPVLNCIRGYPRDRNCGVIATDVYGFHVDSAPVRADTWLCTYHGASSQGLRNDEAERVVDVPTIRAELSRQFGGTDGPAFRAFLRDNFYDLRYVAVARAVPFSMGTHNLWRVAVEYPGSPVPACIHRAPEEPQEPCPRLLLIA